MKILAGGATDKGNVRSTNEDAFLVDLELQLFAVADGMGGHSAGEVASHLALETLHQQVRDNADGPPGEVLVAAVNAASAAIVAEAKADETKARMGTTLTALWIAGDTATIAHVGDSRLYRVRWGEVVKLTEDDTAVQELLNVGAVTPEQAADHPWAHILSQVVGREDALDVEQLSLDLEPGDRFLLCSDGFSDSLSDPRWLTTLSGSPPEESAEALVHRAVELDGRDNATAVVVVVGDEKQRSVRRSSWQRLRRLVRDSLTDLDG